MSFNLSIHDIDFLQNFFNYLQFFFVTPWYDIEKNCVRKPTYSRLYGCCLFLLHILWFGTWIVDPGAQQAVEKSLPSQKVLYCFRTVTLLLLVLFTVLKNVWNFENWGVRFRNFHYVDAQLKNKGRKETKILKNFYSWFLFKHVVVLVVMVCIFSNTLMVLKVPFLTLVRTSSVIFTYYQYLIIVLWLSLIESFKTRYRSLNQKLVTMHKWKYSILEVKKVAQLYGVLGETVEIFNKLFGYQILLIIFQFILELVMSLNIFFFSFISPSQTCNRSVGSMFVMGYIFVSFRVFVVFFYCFCFSIT